MDEEVKKILYDHEERIKKLEKILIGGEKRIAQKAMSIKEFILSKKVGNDVQKTLLIGHFLEKYENYSSFNRKDLEDGFRAAKEIIPKNINDKVNMNIKNEHMMKAREEKDNIKAWVLTSSGERFVENGFKKE